RAVLLDDRWASVREDLVRMWTAGADEAAALAGAVTVVDAAIAAQARWWQDRAERAGRTELAGHYAAIAQAPAAADTPGAWTGEVAVVTGASRGSIAAAVVGDLLGGGAAAGQTTSSRRAGATREG